MDFPWPVLSPTPNALSMAVSFMWGLWLLSSRKFTQPTPRRVDGVGGYMSLAQAPNGVIYLFGSKMGCAAFNESWLKEGKPLPEMK